MTFEGIWDLAESNIENDFGVSLLDIKRSRDCALREVEQLQKYLETMTANYETAVWEKQAIKEINTNLAAQLESVEVKIESSSPDASDFLILETTNKELNREVYHLKTRIAWFEGNQDSVEDLKNDIIALKSKMYDLMMEGK